MEKINCLYSRGVEKTLAAVKDITGIDVNYYAVVKMDVLMDIVDLIGGVEFDVPMNMEYDDPTQNLHINLKKGVQKIDGKKAEMLLRFRHNNDGTSYPAAYGDNDYGRMRTQREFLKATVSEILKFKNITKIKSLLDIIFSNLETNLTVQDIVEYIPYAVNIDIDKVITEQLPGISELCNGLWIYIHNEQDTENLVNTIISNVEYKFN